MVNISSAPLKVIIDRAVEDAIQKKISMLASEIAERMIEELLNDLTFKDDMMTLIRAACKDAINRLT